MVRHHTIQLLLVLLTAPFLHAQTVYQAGLTRELNSGKKPVPNVFIKYKNAVNTTSDDEGHFRLAFQGKAIGERVVLEKIRKEGYEVVNQKELRTPFISGNGQLASDIILAKTGVLASARATYYGVSLAQLKAGYEKKVNQLTEALLKAELAEEMYDARIAELDNQLQAQQASLTELSERFSRVNFDDVSDLYQEALTLFQAGKIDSCKLLLEKIKPIERVNGRLKERVNIRNLRGEADNREEANEAGLQEDINLLRLQAQTHLLAFELEAADTLYHTLLNLDSTDIEFLQEIGDFFELTHQYERASSVYRRIKTLPHASLLHKSDASLKLGSIDFTVGEYEKASTSLLACLAIAQSDSTHPPENEPTDYSTGLACQYLGYIHLLSGQVDSAQFYQALNLRDVRRSVQKFPSSGKVMSNLAIAYGKMGEIFMRKMVYDSALSYFHANASIMDSLLTKLPKEPVYLDDMTSAWVALGDAFNTIGRTDSSLFYFRKGLATATSLHKLFPQSIDFQDELALTYERMGDLKWKMGQLDSALYFFKADLSLSQILHQEYPANIRFQNLLANALQKSGEIHSIQGHADSALVYAYQDYKLCKKIVQKTPQNLTFQFDLAGSAGTLGRFFLDDFNLDSASKYFIEDYAIMESLYDSFPDHAVVVEGLVNSANNLGIVATYQEDNARAIAYHKKAFRLCSNLAARNPSVLTHKASISVSASYIGNIFAVNGTYDSAIYYYSFIKVYSQELASLDSTNITYHFHYAASLQLIGDVYYQTQDYEQAKDIYKEGIGAFMTLRRLSPLTLEYARGLFIVQQNLGKTFARLGVLDSASHYLRIAQKTILSLSEAFPENKELTSSVVASLYDIHEYYGLQEQDFEQARQYLDEAEKVQAQLAEAVPDYMAYQQDLAFLREKQQQLAFPSIYLLLTKITYEADTLTMYGLFAQLADSLKKEIAHYPHGKEKLTDVLNEKAWLGMFLGKLKESEVDLLEVLAMNADQDAARARLALVHLALGQYKRAKEICQTHMDEPFGDHEQDLLFKEVCLKDLDALERAGAIPPKRKKDVAKIRKLLGP